jgi:hypothetical protein
MMGPPPIDHTFYAIHGVALGSMTLSFVASIYIMFACFFLIPRKKFLNQINLR